jgi:hypothetical protein
VDAPGAITLRFAHDPELAREVAELAALETGCCSFLTFRLDIETDALRLTASAPPMFNQTLKRMFSTSPSATT